MADSHEEQLLNDLLRGIAREDAHVGAAHLEARVLAAMDARELTRPRPMASYLVIAAALLASVWLPAVYWTQQSVETEPVSAATDATEVPIPDERAATAADRKAHALSPAPQTARLSSSERTRSTAPDPIAQSPIADAPVIQLPIAQSPVTQSPDEFVPLMPITAQELTGSFQIVRVQMPNASLGALRSPLEQPNELIEADVLLGEDGMARGIRLAASGSAYPWRSR